jgi:H+/Cl- antiporter ClcA
VTGQSPRKTESATASWLARGRAGLDSGSPHFFPDATGAVVLLGIVSYFTGVVQAPITAFVIVSEMTNDHTMLVP